VLDLSVPCARVAESLGVVVPAELAPATRTTWLGRMVNEYRSGAVFEHTAKVLARAGCSTDVVDTCLGFATEERHHGVLCGAVVLRAGGEARAVVGPDEPFPEHADTTARAAAVRNLVSISCMAETVAVALVGDERERMPEGPLRELLTRIWADEIGHARFGWRTVAALLPELDADEREAVHAYLPVAFRAPPGGDEVGLCSGLEARELFYATVEHAVVSGLEAIGLPAAEAWRRRAAFAPSATIAVVA
jgi:hypothetical protein